MSDYVIETVELEEGFTIEILPDDDPISPRDYDNLGTMVCWHRRYKLGDEHSFESPQDFKEWLKENGGEEKFLIMPLYLYDHSGITMSTGPFSCPWDSGQVGYYYASLDKLRKEYGKRLTKKRLDTAKKVLQGEVENYDLYIRGGYVGYVIKGADGDEVGSCWGFDDMKYAIEEAKDEAEHFIEKTRESKARAMEAERPDMYVDSPAETC
jgi:hypothetical protein